MTVITPTILIAHLLLLVFAYVRARERTRGLKWLLAAIALSMVGVGTFLLREDLLMDGKSVRGLALIVALIAALTAFGGLVIDDLASRRPRGRLMQVWLGVNGVWLALVVLAALLSDTSIVGGTDWLEVALTQPDAPSLLAIVGLGISGLLLLGLGFYDFYLALMPEVSNRALFWVSNAAILLLSIIMTASGIYILILLGMFGLFFSMAAATYAYLNYNVLDLRSTASLAGRTLVVIAFTAVFVLAALLIADRVELDPGFQTLLFLAVVALVVAMIYVPVRQIAELVLSHLLSGPMTDTTVITRLYSEAVSQEVELKKLIETACKQLNTALKIRRSGIMLVSSTGGGDGTLELSVMEGGAFANLKGVKGHLPLKGSVYQTLAAKRTPVMQFDLEYSPAHQDMTQQEKQFFRSLQMSAFAPIIVERTFIGVIACGPKLDDSAFNHDDIQLLATLAQQTGVALRNARLVADLRHLNVRMQSLNVGLEKTKEELESLDSVKTDFVTIASHELRTPLAQIRGYTDIIDALNEQGMLDEDQLKSMVGNLRKATERTEELIAAMLDVSQLDVNAMDLRFAQTTAESVLRLAIEPLTDVIKQRKLTLSARGLRGLPPIQADMQRMVQAFRNIIVNAIKFTPDGGRIDISAALKPTETEGGVDHIVVQIKDTGVGIAPQNLSLVFQKFFRGYDPSLHSTGAYKFLGAGPGLGLTIAKGVIEGHGGKIWAESPGHSTEEYPGATFFVELPVSPPEDARRVLPFEGDGKASPESASPKLAKASTAS
jgi:signal transduction histidine kinase